MKKTTVLFAVLALTTAGAFATEVAKETANLTLAAAEISTKAVWVETEEDAQLRIKQELSEKTAALVAQVNIDLQKQFSDKLAKDLNI